MTDNVVSLLILHNDKLYAFENLCVRVYAGGF